MKEACAILTRHSFSALPQKPSHKRLAIIETTFLSGLQRARIFTSKGIKR